MKEHDARWEDTDEVASYNDLLLQAALVGGAVVVGNRQGHYQRCTATTEEYHATCSGRAMGREARRASALAATLVLVVGEPRSPHESTGSCLHGSAGPDSTNL